MENRPTKSTESSARLTWQKVSPLVYMILMIVGIVFFGILLPGYYN